MPGSDRRADRAPWVVAVTGGIGSGKTRVARAFAALGARVIDADRIAREVIEEPECRDRLRREFGESIFGGDGRIDRRALAERVFADPALRRLLEGIIHPEVRRRIDKELADLGASGSDDASPLPGKRPLVLLDIPLLETSPYHDRADVVLFVEAPESDRRRRVAETRGWSEGELIRREASQVPLDEKRRRAHRILPNPDPRDPRGSDPEGEAGGLSERCRALVEEWRELLAPEERSRPRTENDRRSPAGGAPPA